MRYVAPYGVSNPDAPYINGDPTIGRQGSIPPAEAFEHPMREIVSVIEKSDFLPSDDDLQQLTKGIRSQFLNFAEDTGSLNVLSVAFDPPLSSYSMGLPIHVRVHASNTGEATIDAGAGRVPIKRANGLPTLPGDLPAGAVVLLIYDGSAFQLVNFLGTGTAGGGSVTINQQNLPYCVDTSTTANIIIAPFVPAITTLTAGTCFLVKIANTNTSDAVINVNALNNNPIRVNCGDTKLLPGDVMAGDIKLFVYDGANFYIEPNPLIPANVTINVPAQYPHPNDALAALSRKTIHKNAIVTIQMASGIYPGDIKFNHADADRMIIQGTMIGATPAYNQYSHSGYNNTVYDGNNNIAMLRSRYGTEIRLTVNNSTGCTNHGPGCPIIQDVLIVGLGSGAHGGNPYQSGVEVGNSTPQGKSIQPMNVAIWGATWGLYGNGLIRAIGGSCTFCFFGSYTLGGGILLASNHLCMANAWGGYIVSMHSHLNATGCIADSNRNYAVYVSSGSEVHYAGCWAINSGLFDWYTCWNSLLESYSSAAYTFSPPLQVEGNFNSLNIAV